MKWKNRFRQESDILAGLLITIMIAIPTLSNAATYYVSTNGKDTNKGTQSAPFGSIKHALVQLGAGDKLLIRAGTYTEKLESHKGTDFPRGSSWNKPVTVKAFRGEHVILKGKISIGKEKPRTKYVIFDGISIDATGFESGISINGGARRLRFINGEVKNAIGTSGITISYNNDDVGGKTYHEFINMQVHHNGLDTSVYTEEHGAKHRHGFYIKTAGNLIESCDIHDNAGAGIHHYVRAEDPRADNNIYRNNLIHNNGSESGSGIGITINRGDNNLVYNNVVWGNHNGIKVNNIGKPKGNKIYHNTVFGHQGIGIGVLSGATNTKIINNISYQNGHNLINEGTNTTSNKNVTSNPLFRNVSTADFRLQVGNTNALAKGVPLKEVTRDKNGVKRSSTAPDIGAYEQNPKPPIRAQRKRKLKITDMERVQPSPHRGEIPK